MQTKEAYTKLLQSVVDGNTTIEEAVDTIAEHVNLYKEENRKLSMYEAMYLTLYGQLKNIIIPHIIH